MIASQMICTRYLKCTPKYRNMKVRKIYLKTCARQIPWKKEMAGVECVANPGLLPQGVRSDSQSPS